MAQDIRGNWFGLLEFPGAKLRLVLHVSGYDGQYKATLDSPDQGKQGFLWQEHLLCRRRKGGFRL